MVGVAEPQLDREGRRLAFVRKVIDERSRPQTSIWWTPTDGQAAPRALTAGPKDSSPRFSPDGTRLAFLRTTEEKGTQIAVLPLDGGEAKLLSRFPEGSLRSLAWSPSGSHLAVAFRPTEEERTHAARKERERDGRSEPPRVLDTRWHSLDGDGWFGASRYALHLVDARTGRHEEIYGLDSIGHFDFAWSPDGRRLALTTNRDPDAILKPWKDEVVILDLEAGTIEPLPNQPIGPKTAVAWSPDGSMLAWAGRTGRDGVYSTENLELWVAPAIPGGRGKAAPRSLTKAEDLCVHASTLTDAGETATAPSVLWRPDSKAIWTRLGWHGAGHLAELPIDGSKPRVVTEGFREHLLGNVAANGSVAALRSDPTTLAEAGVLTVAKGKATWRGLTRFNHALLAELSLSTPTSHWVKAADGHPTQVWILEPPPGAARPAARAGTARRGKRPAIIEVHGGPHAQYGAPFFHEFQLLAAQGYVVAYSNPRGSKGYGRDHCAAIRGSWGDKDWLDVQAVTAFVAQRKDVDPKRIGIMGGSYGGYMTNWAIAHSKAYRAAITDRCVSNLLSFAGNSDYPLVPGEYWPGTNYENPEPLWRSSPIAHFKGVTTPTLIIHSEGDFRCNIEQSEEIHTALVVQGVPCRFVRYPLSTSHGMSRNGPPDLRIHRLNEILGWWSRWL